MQCYGVCTKFNDGVCFNLCSMSKHEISGWLKEEKRKCILRENLAKEAKLAQEQPVQEQGQPASKPLVAKEITQEQSKPIPEEKPVLKKDTHLTEKKIDIQFIA